MVNFTWSLDFAMSNNKTFCLWCFSLNRFFECLQNSTATINKCEVYCEVDSRQLYTICWYRLCASMRNVIGQWVSEVNFDFESNCLTRSRQSSVATRTINRFIRKIFKSGISMVLKSKKYVGILSWYYDFLCQPVIYCTLLSYPRELAQNRASFTKCLKFLNSNFTSSCSYLSTVLIRRYS